MGQSRLFKLQFLRTARLMVRANDKVFTVHTPHYTRSQVHLLSNIA